MFNLYLSPFFFINFAFVKKNNEKVTFDGAAVLASFEEGSPAEFNCMNEHYGMSFVKGPAGEKVAVGELTSGKVQ